MYGINLDKKITFFNAGERFFKKGEKHISRTGQCDVLLLVFDGVLKFNINGEDVEVNSGEYYIQRKGTIQIGNKASLCPKYFFIHFNAKWGDTQSCLPYKGNFSYGELEKYMKNLSYYFGSEKGYVEQIFSFYSILLNLYENSRNDKETLAMKIMNYIRENYLKISSLDEICESLAFSKNHIINIFKKEYRTTPTKYILELKIKKAMFLLESSTLSISEIAIDCGFNNYSHFYRKFIEYTQLSPEHWREVIHNPESTI